VKEREHSQEGETYRVWNIAILNLQLIERTLPGTRGGDQTLVQNQVKVRNIAILSL